MKDMKDRFTYCTLLFLLQNFKSPFQYKKCKKKKVDVKNNDISNKFYIIFFFFLFNIFIFMYRRYV